MEEVVRMTAIRPEALLAVVAAGVQSDFDAEVLAEAADIADVEKSRLRLLDRWSLTRGSVVVKVSQLPPIRGQVVLAGEQCVLITSADTSSWLISVPAIIWVEGLQDGLRAESPAVMTPPRNTWPHLMRGWEGSLLRCHLDDGSTVVGYLNLIGADHFELDLKAESRLLVFGFSALLAVEHPGRMGGLGRNPESADTSWR